MIKAVIFDSDGTLLNSFELIVAAYAHVVKTHGLRRPTTEEIRPLLARALTIPEILGQLFPDADSGQLLATKSAFITANADKAAAFAGIHDMLEHLQATGLVLGIVTGGNHKIHDVLVHNKIDSHFTSVVHCDRVQFGKPHPEGVLLALDELGVRPTEAVMVGDSKNDILAGKNARLAYCIGITHGHGLPDELRAAGADYIVNSLSEVTELLQKLRTEQSALQQG